MGAAFHFLLSRARPAKSSEGTMMDAGPQGRSLDGGWLARKQLPPAGVISKGIAVLGIATCIAVAASQAFGGSRRKARVRRRRASSGEPKRT
ncbi:hypothetical protein ACVWZR_000504 [Bradyrhizobium sp. i1.3.1]